MAHRRKLIAGNWKMNGLRSALGELRAIVAASAELSKTVDLAICPPALIAPQAAEALAGSGVALGGQDCHADPSGAHTGDLSAEMWADAGARYVIVGHSERRMTHHETDAHVRNKASAALRAGLVPIICLGETLGQRDAGETLAVIGTQLSSALPADAPAARVVIAYEPVWAIGTGRTPTLDQVRQAHEELRRGLREALGQGGDAVRVLYGGSVKPDNARDLMQVEDVDGALVGGASLKASDFMAIVRAAV